MTKAQREIQRKLRTLRYAEAIGHVAKTCHYFGIGRASFYSWRKAYAERGGAGLVNAPNGTPTGHHLSVKKRGSVANFCKGWKGLDFGHDYAASLANGIVRLFPYA